MDISNLLQNYARDVSFIEILMARIDAIGELHIRY